MLKLLAGFSLINISIIFAHVVEHSIARLSKSVIKNWNTLLLVLIIGYSFIFIELSILHGYQDGRNVSFLLLLVWTFNVYVLKEQLHANFNRHEAETDLQRVWNWSQNGQQDDLNLTLDEIANLNQQFHLLSWRVPCESSLELPTKHNLSDMWITNSCVVQVF
jgi:hypothetical protein